MGEFIKQITGVDLTDANGEFRSTYDILNDIGKVWDTLNSKEQAMLAEEIAGKNRANILTSIMQNAKQLEAAYESLSNSAGSANAEQEAYMDSLAGKINALKQSFTRITIHTINSDMFKGLVDGATKGINAVDKFIQKFGGIGTAVMVTIPMLTTCNKSISTITKGFTTSIPVIGDWQSKIQTSLGKQSEVIANAKAGMDDLKKSVANGTTSYNEASKGMANYQKQIAGATAKTLALHAAQSVLNMAIGVGISALIGGAIASIQKYLDYIKFTNEEAKQLADSNNKLSESMKEINSKDNLVNKYKDLNNQLKNVNETSKKTKELHEEINKVRSQLATDSGYADIVNNENLSLEKQIELLETAQKKKMLDNAYEIKDNLPSKKAIEKELKAMENYIKSYEQYKDMLNTPPDKNGMITWLDDFGTEHEITYSSIKENMDLYSRKLMESKEKLDTYNDSLVRMGEYGLTTTRVQAEYPSIVNKIVDSLLNATDGAAQTDKGLKNLSSTMRQTTADTETLIKDLNDIKAPDWDLGKIAGHLDLSQVSNELVRVTEETKNAQNAMEMYLGIFDGIGNQISNIDDIVEAINEAGGMTDEVLDKIIATGDAELIAIADNSNALQDYLNLKQEDIDLKKEARDKAIEQANAEVEGRNRLLEQFEKEKQKQEELNTLREKYRSLSMTEDGKVVSSLGMEVKQFSKVIQGIEDTKKAVIDLDGQMSLVTFDKDGRITGEFVKVKEVAENMFSVIQQNATGDKMFSLTIDSNGDEIKTELESVTEAIDGTYVAVTELNGQKVTVNFNDSGEIVSEIGQVVDRFDGLKESIIEINGTKFSMIIDADGEIISPLVEIQTSIDGTIQKVEEINGKQVVLSLGDDGVFREDIEATNNLIDDFKDNIETLNGKSIVVNIDGAEQLASDLREITQETDGVYNAIATVNGQEMRIRIDEDGNLLEVIEELGSVKQAVSDTQYAFESMGNGWTVTNVDGVMTWIWNVHDGLDGLKIGIGEINETPIRVEFDESGNYKIQELQWNLDGLLETNQVIDGKTVTCTYDLNGNLIEQKEVVSEVNELLDSTNGKEASATANIDTNEAESRAKIVNEELMKIDEKSAKATIEVENNDSVEKVEEVKESVDSVDGTKAEVSVNVDSSQANSKLDNTKKKMKETENAGKKLEKNVVKPKVDISSSMNNLQLLRGTIQQTKQEASKPVVVTARENGISNVIGLLRNLLDKINNARSQARNPITITTVHKEATQYSTTGSPTPKPSKRSASEQTTTEDTSSMYEQIATPKVRSLNDIQTPEIISEPSTADSNGDTGAVTTSNNATRASSKSTDAISSIGGNIDELNYYYKAIESCTSALKDYNQALQEVRDTSEDHKKWLYLQIDRYFRLNDAIEDYDNLLKYNAELQKSVAVGSSDYYRLQREELYLYQKKIEALKSLQAEQVKEKDEIASLLKQNGFVIDSYGNLLNSQELLANEMAKINGLSDNDPNKDFYIENIKTLSNYVNRYTSLMNKDIAGTREEILSLQNTIKNTATNSLEELRNKLVSALQSQREEEKEKELGVLDDRIEELKKQLKDLDDESEDKKTKRAKLEAELAKWERDDSAYGKAQVKKLREQLEKLNKEIAKDEINKEIENIESEKDKLQEIFDKKLEEKEIYAEADRLLASKNMEEIKKLLERYTDTFKDLGGLLGNEFTTNFKSQIEECFKALEYLKGQSSNFVSGEASKSRSSVNQPSLAMLHENQAESNFTAKEMSRLALLNQNNSLFGEIQMRAWSEMMPKLASLDNIPNMNNDALRNVVNGDINSNNKIEINNEFNVTNHTEMDVRKTEKTLEQAIRSDLRRFGKIK